MKTIVQSTARSTTTQPSRIGETNLRPSSTALSGADHTSSSRQHTAASSGARKPVRVLLADDHPVVRKGLASCLAASPSVAIVGEATNGQDVMRKARELTPDIILMDIDMPLLNGLTAADLLRKENPNLKV